MNLPKMHRLMSWIIFGITFCIFTIGSIEQAGAFNPQPEPPGLIMPTLIPDDALRVNIAYVTDQSKMSSRCKIYIQSLFTGHILVEEDITLEPNKGMSKDYSYRELLTMNGGDDSLLDNAGDMPLRVHVETTTKKNIFVGVEIHDAIFTFTRTYIPIGAGSMR